MSILQAKWVVEQTNQQEETITQIQNVEHSTGNWSELWKKTNIVEKSVCACVCARSSVCILYETRLRRYDTQMQCVNLDWLLVWVKIKYSWVRWENLNK